MTEISEIECILAWPVFSNVTYELLNALTKKSPTWGSSTERLDMAFWHVCHRSSLFELAK
jgi:hypothetical protein